MPPATDTSSPLRRRPSSPDAAADPALAGHAFRHAIGLVAAADRKDADALERDVEGNQRFMDGDEDRIVGPYAAVEIPHPVLS